MVGSVLRRSNSEQDFVPRSRNRRFLTTGIDDTEEENENDIWVVADPCSPDFGQKYTNMKAIAEKGMACGEYCLVPSEKGGGGKEAILLRQAASCASFKSEFYSQARPQMAALEAMIKLKTPNSADKRTHERREELSHWDMVAARPALRAHRVLFALLIISLVVAVLWANYEDGKVSSFTPMLVTIGYPLALLTVSRIMLGRQPAGDFVFELLLVFDLYHFVSSAAIFVGVIREAAELGMLLPPIGHAATTTSPTLRALVWLHFSNRIFELLDTIFRTTQKKFKAYGALHFYLRLVSVWSWYAATQVAGGDVWVLLVSYFGV